MNELETEWIPYDDDVIIITSTQATRASSTSSLMSLPSGDLLFEELAIHDAQNILFEHERDHIDYIDRIRFEQNEREEAERLHQSINCSGYMNYLKNMETFIDEWLKTNDVDPDEDFYYYANHNWCYRFLPFENRLRLTMLRAKLEKLEKKKMEEEEERFWQQVEANEAAAKANIPICVICQFDLRNAMFNVITLSMCGHQFHERCINRAFVENKTCPCCRRQQSIENGIHTHILYA